MTSTPRARSEHPTAPPDIDAYLARFAWHPEPELIGYRDEEASRGPMTTLAADTWTTALDFLYGHAADRAMGDTRPHDVLRRAYHGGSGPGPAPADPMTARGVLDEFQQRIAGGLMNSQHPRQFGYFTPPPLPMSMMGELLAQMTNQGVDVWHAGPVAAFVEEEVVRWLCDIVGYDDGRFRAAHVRRRDGQFHGDGPRPRRPSGATRWGRTAAARRDARRGPRLHLDQTHFSIARALDLLGFPRETLVVVEADERFHLRAGPVVAAVARDRAAGLVPFAIAAVAGSTNTGSVDAVGELADVADAEDLWLHVDAAYGGAARLSRRDAGRVPDLERADSVTVDPHKWFFQAYDIGGLLVRDGALLAQVFGGRAPEYYRGGETPALSGEVPDDIADEPRRPRRPGPAELLQAELRRDPPLARAEAVDVVEAPRNGWVRASDRADRRPRGPISPAGAPRPTTSRPSPRFPTSASSASGTCPAAATPRSRARRVSSMRTRTPSSVRSRCPATAGSRRRGCVARRGFGPGS